MIAALFLAAAVATPAPSPTLPASMWSVRISSGPAVPRFIAPAHVPHDFRTLSAIVAVADGRAPVSAIPTPAPSPARVYVDRSTDAWSAPMSCTMAAERRFGPQAYGEIIEIDDHGTRSLACAEFSPAVLHASPAPSPTPKTIAHVVASGDPCAHRILCGPIRLLPRTAAGRADLVAALADGIVTAIGTHGDPSREAGPVVRPFIRGGFPLMMLAWGAQEVARHAMLRRMPALSDVLDAREASSHVLGFGSWLSPGTYGWSPVPSKQILAQPLVQRMWMLYDLHLPWDTRQ